MKFVLLLRGEGELAGKETDKDFFSLWPGISMNNCFHGELCDLFYMNNVKILFGIL